MDIDYNGESFEFLIYTPKIESLSQKNVKCYHMNSRETSKADAK